MIDTSKLTLSIKIKPMAMKILKPIWFIQVICKTDKLYMPDWAFESVKLTK